jgi:hypothetical protein
MGVRYLTIGLSALTLLGIRLLYDLAAGGITTDDRFLPPRVPAKLARAQQVQQEEIFPLPGPVGRTGSGKAPSAQLPGPQSQSLPSPDIPFVQPSPTVDFLPPGSKSTPGSSPQPAQQQGHSHADGTSCPGCNPRCETRTIMVPEWHVENELVMRTSYRNELRQRPVCVTRVVTDQVPELENYTVYVTEDRSRDYVVYRTQKIPYPVQRMYTEMVEREQVREYTLYKSEAYQVPVEQTYTVMLPETRHRQYTTMRTITEQVPDVEYYTVMVPETRVRPVVNYKEVQDTEIVKIPYTEMVTETRQKNLIVYETKKEKRIVTLPKIEMVPTEKFRNQALYSYETTQTPIIEQPYAVFEELSET